MKKLFILATSIGFIPQNLSISWKTDSYLWMCELQKWLREKHRCEINVRYYCTDGSGYAFDLFPKNSLEVIHFYDFKTYEEALEKALIESLKLI